MCIRDSLQVFLQLCRTSQNYNLIYLASCEEEVSGKEGIESVLPGLPPVSFAIVGEPTEMQPAKMCIRDSLSHCPPAHYCGQSSYHNGPEKKSY